MQNFQVLTEESIHYYLDGKSFIKFLWIQTPMSILKIVDISFILKCQYFQQGGN